ncbi:hypothetical protein AJ79_00586 [Helicocarpus griseus UAMH5409]|uniref:Uncharacterized protein n=1 Tax=Helicocarpus griseus UAMH5409 TaxID=1447875 RepID=A0A2B7YCC9_9EURO|nr:hypothetical protein AJ79_00586 [Helicocarpus griseus UAMH5409]
MILSRTLSATAGTLVSYNRFSPREGDGPGYIRSTLCRAKARISQLSSPQRTTKRLSKHKASSEGTCVCRSLHFPSEGAPSPSVPSESYGDANGFRAPPSSGADDGFVVVEVVDVASIEPSSSIEPLSSPATAFGSSSTNSQNEDLAQAETNLPDEDDGSELSLPIAGGSHTVYIATLGNEGEASFRDMVDEENQDLSPQVVEGWMAEMRNLMEEKRDWQAKFATAIRVRNDMQSTLKQERSWFEKYQKDAEAKISMLEAHVEYQETRLRNMETKLQETESKVREAESKAREAEEQIDPCYVEIGILCEQNKDICFENSQLHHDLEQKKEEHQRLQFQYQTLEQRLIESETDSCRANQEVEKLTVATVELEARLKIAETEYQASTVKGLETELTLSRCLQRDAEERGIRLERLLENRRVKCRSREKELIKALSTYRAELLFKDRIIENTQEIRRGYLNVFKEALLLLSTRADGDKLTLDIAAWLSRTLDRNEQLEMEVVNLRTHQDSAVNDDSQDIG